MSKEIIGIGGDHAGYEYKERLKPFLESKEFEVKDFGPYSTDSADYPDFVHPLCSSIESGDFSRGILICGTGNGVAITANHHQGIRAGLAWNVDVASLVKAHNNANVLCMPARFVSYELAEQMVDVWLRTEFEAGRHERRINKIPC